MVESPIRASAGAVGGEPPGSSPAVSVRKILAPVEHGGWGILFEPIVLALLVEPTWRGVLIGLAALAAFLMRQPLKLAAGDRLRGKIYPRTEVAGLLAAGLASLAIILGSAAFLGGSWNAAIPLILAAPAALVLLWFDCRSRSRELAAELSGAVAMGALAPSIALAGGAAPGVAYALWLVMLARSLPAILFVRTRLRLGRGRPARRWPVTVVHAASAMAGVTVAARAGAPLLVALALTILFTRSCFGLYRPRPAVSPKQIGWSEVAFGAVTVLLAGIGFAAGI